MIASGLQGEVGVMYQFGMRGLKDKKKKTFPSVTSGSL